MAIEKRIQSAFQVSFSRRKIRNGNGEYRKENELGEGHNSTTQPGASSYERAIADRHARVLPRD